MESELFGQDFDINKIIKSSWAGINTSILKSPQDLDVDITQINKTKPRGLFKEALVNIWSSSINGLSRLIHGSETDPQPNITYPYAIEKSKSGLISPLGGSWTLFRKIGEDTVDYIIKKE